MSPNSQRQPLVSSTSVINDAEGVDTPGQLVGDAKTQLDRVRYRRFVVGGLLIMASFLGCIIALYLRYRSMDSSAPEATPNATHTA